MKKVINVTEIEGEGLESYLGERVLLFCVNYIYTGLLVGVNQTCVRLDDPYIVYETGAFSQPGYKDAQKLHASPLYVQISAIEAFGATK